MPIKKSGEKFEVYGYWGKKEPPEIPERCTYAAAYDIPTGGTIILVYHNILGSNSNFNVLLLPPFIMIESGW